MEKLTTIDIITTPLGKNVLDLGRNMRTLELCNLYLDNRQEDEKIKEGK